MAIDLEKDIREKVRKFSDEKLEKEIFFAEHAYAGGYMSDAETVWHKALNAEYERRNYNAQ